MTATIYMPQAARKALEESASPRPSLFARIFAAIAEAQSRKADRRIGGHLAMLGDDRLLALGFAAEEIEAIRAGAPSKEVMARRWRSAI